MEVHALLGHSPGLQLHGGLRDAIVVEGQWRIGKVSKLSHSSPTEGATGKLTKQGVITGMCKNGYVYEWLCPDTYLGA